MGWARYHIVTVSTSSACYTDPRTIASIEAELQQAGGKAVSEGLLELNDSNSIHQAGGHSRERPHFILPPYQILAYYLAQDAGHQSRLPPVRVRGSSTMLRCHGRRRCNELRGGGVIWEEA